MELVDNIGSTFVYITVFKMRTFLVINLALMVVQLAQTKAVSQNQGNHTMRFYVFPMSDWEAEALERQSRQVQGGISGGRNGSSASSSLPPAGTGSNVINILTGFFREDVRPILSGGTAFIPQGELREGVTGILYGLAPALQKLLFGDGSSVPAVDNTIATAAPIPYTEIPTSPPPQRRRTTTTIDPDLASASPTPEENSEEETESATQQQDSTTALPPSSSAQPTTDTATSAESDEETEQPVVAAVLSTSAPSSADATSAPASPAQVSDSDATERVSAVTPESAREPAVTSQPQNVAEPKPQATTSTGGSGGGSISPAATPTVTQLKVVLEDASSIVTANVLSNATGEDKQYIYLVLLPEQYEQLNQLTSLAKPQNKHPEFYLEPEASSPLPQQIMQEKEEEEKLIITSTSTLPTTTTTATTLQSTNRHRNRNKNRTTTVPPLHLQLQYYYRFTTSSPSTTTTTTTTTTEKPTTSTDLPGVKGFEGDDDELELEPSNTIY